MTLKIVREFTQGYGTQIAFSAYDNLWVTVEPAQFHVRRGGELLYSTPLGGFFGGSPRFSRDGRALYIGTRIFDLSQRRFIDLPALDSALMANLPPQSNANPEQFEISGAAWSPDGEQLVIHAQHRPPRDSRVTAKYTGPWKRLLLLNGRTRAVIATLLETSTSEEYTALDVCDAFIAAGALSVQVWNRADQKRLAQLEGFNVAFRDVRFNADGSLLAAAAWDGQVAVWETNTWQRIAVWAAHEDFARCVSFHPRQPLLATGGGDSNLNLWRIGARAERSDSLDLESKVVAVAFHPDGEGLAASLDDGRVVLCSYAG